MMRRNNESLINKLLNVGSEDENVSEKEAYVAPALTIVKFMFENDITWGSFSNTPGSNDGQNFPTDESKKPVEEGDDWWG